MNYDWQIIGICIVLLLVEYQIFLLSREKYNKNKFNDINQKNYKIGAGFRVK